MATITLDVPQLVDFAAAQQWAKKVGAKLLSFSNDGEEDGFQELDPQLLEDIRIGREQFAKGDFTTFHSEKEFEEFFENL